MENYIVNIKLDEFYGSKKEIQTALRSVADRLDDHAGLADLGIYDTNGNYRGGASLVTEAE